MFFQPVNLFDLIPANKKVEFYQYLSYVTTTSLYLDDVSAVVKRYLFGFLLQSRSYKSVFYQPENFGDLIPTSDKVTSTYLMLRPLHFIISADTHLILLGLKKRKSLFILRSSSLILCNKK